MQVQKLEIDNETIVCEYLIRNENVVILHGAGKSGRDRYYDFADNIMRRGYGVVLFDFSGHGDSSGQLGQSSLARRKSQAYEVIKRLLPEDSTFYLIGFSMGAQTASDLLNYYGARIPAILLGCPGIYDRKAVDIKFDNSNFTKTIRANNSWQNSLAIDSLREYNGETIVVIGEEDPVIPKDVISLITRNAKDPTLLTYAGVDHQLAKWLSLHTDELEHLVDELLKT